MTSVEERIWQPFAGSEAPPELDRWGHDHWSTLAYIETRVVDARGILGNAQMRTNASVHPNLAAARMGGALNSVEYPTRLRDGELSGHDDWSCLADMVALGLAVAEIRELPYPSAVRVRLTPLGEKIAGQLRAHKGRGNRYGEFQPLLQPHERPKPGRLVGKRTRSASWAWRVARAWAHEKRLGLWQRALYAPTDKMLWALGKGLVVVTRWRAEAVDEQGFRQWQDVYEVREL